MPLFQTVIQRIVEPDGFTLTASFAPIFDFTASCRLVHFHGHCTRNVQFKLIIAIMITETTVIRTEDSSEKTNGNSNKKTATETIRQEQRYYFKRDQKKFFWGGKMFIALKFVVQRYTWIQG